MISLIFSIFYVKLNCEVGMLGLVRRQQSRFLVQLFFGFRRVNIEIFTEAIPASINEEFTRVQYSITHIFEIINYFFYFDFALSWDFDNLSPRMDVEIFAGCHSSEPRFRTFGGVWQSISTNGLRNFRRMPFDRVVTNNLNAKWGYLAWRDDNKDGSLTDLYSSEFSCALDFVEWT
ncbi:LOW QUALITY PROTEIN: hypothetical protein V1477_018630 [Vespula maculifrons]|uniref:Uncharacterized protein n=1 Tax=Vespula maculifrons TaxID=7453 RepID=A0ABD2AVX9_VESMC